MVKPSFIIPGAPKCGTTTLAAWLAEHPDICMASRKEPNYFAPERKDSGVTTWESYCSLFDHCSQQHTAIGEASTNYLLRPESIAAIEHALAEPRYVVCLRRPRDLVHSLYWQRVYEGKESAASFAEAWRRSRAARANGAANAPGDVPAELDYCRWGMLGSQIAYLLDVAGPERVCCVALPDLQSQPAAVYRSVLAFLGVRDDGRTDFPVFNVHKQRRWPLLQVAIQTGVRLRNKLGLRPMRIGLANWVSQKNQKPSEKPELPDWLAREIDAFYTQEMVKLQRLTNLDVSEW